MQSALLDPPFDSQIIPHFSSLPRLSCRPSSTLCHLIRPRRCQLKFYLYCFRFRCSFLFWLLFRTLSPSLCYAARVRGRCLGDQFDLQFVAPCHGTDAERIHSVTCPICLAHPLEYLSSSNCNSCHRPPFWSRPCSGNCNLSLGHVACPHLQLWRDCSFSFTVTFRPDLACPVLPCPGNNTRPHFRTEQPRHET